jgi:hypothetical protein
MPKLTAHLPGLSIDLPAICFSWFLSLFTNCLPAEDYVPPTCVDVYEAVAKGSKFKLMVRDPGARRARVTT